MIKAINEEMLTTLREAIRVRLKDARGEEPSDHYVGILLDASLRRAPVGFDAITLWHALQLMSENLSSLRKSPDLALKQAEALKSIRETLEEEQFDGFSHCHGCGVGRGEPCEIECMFTKLFEILDGAMPKGGA